MDDSWMDELRELDGALRPTPNAIPKVRRRLRRRRKVRALGAVGGSAALVVASIVTVSLVSGPDAKGTDGLPAATTPSSSPSITPAPSPEESGLFDCETDNPVFGPSPAIPDRGRQQRIVDQIERPLSDAFDVHVAEPSHLGVVALVTGDLDAARRALREHGVGHVYSWDSSGPEVGADEHGQIEQALQWVLDPVVNRLQKQIRDVPGSGGLAYWQDAGAVLLQWKAPVPAEIEALAGVRPNGVKVIVQAIRYSDRDFLNAGERALKAGREGRIDAKVNSAVGCGDGSGLVVGVGPKSLGDRRAELQQKLTELVGMPVKVVAEEAPVPLVETVGR